MLHGLARKSRSPEGSTSPRPPFHQETEHTDPDGNVTVSAYDGMGELISQTTGYGTPQAETTQYAYANGLMTSMTDADGNNTVYNSPQTFDVEVDGTVIGTFTPSGTSYTLYTTSAFTVAAEMYVVEFVGLAPNGQGSMALIDEVSLQGGTPSSPPAPASSGVSWTYSYDAANEMTSATETDSQGQVLVQANYTYDVFGHRIESSVSLNGGAPTTTQYIYNGDTLWATLTGSDETLYVSGDQPDQYFFQIDTNTGVSWYLTDHLGSVTGVMNNAGQETNAITYDAYGNIIAQSNPAAAVSIEYAGYYWDPALGAYSDGARIYGPDIQRYYTQDPTGLGPDSNPYRYVHNGPTDYTDPSGEAPLAVNPPETDQEYDDLYSQYQAKRATVNTYNRIITNLEKRVANPWPQDNVPELQKLLAEKRKYLAEVTSQRDALQQALAQAPPEMVNHRKLMGMAIRQEKAANPDLYGLTRPTQHKIRNDASLLFPDKGPYAVRLVRGFLRAGANSALGTVELGGDLVTDPGKMYNALEALATDEKVRKQVANQILEQLKQKASAVAKGDPGAIGEVTFELAITVPVGIGAAQKGSQVARLVFRGTKKSLTALAGRLTSAEGAAALKKMVDAANELKKAEDLFKAAQTAEEVAAATKRLEAAQEALRALTAPQSGVRGYLKNLRSYWERSTGGLTQEEATALAKREGFGFEVGRQSRFENARDSVVIGRGNLQEGLVNRMELAEEIQHGLDRATHQASRAIRRGLSNEEFHAELFERIIEHHKAGGHQFLTPEDIKAFQEAIKELRGR